MTAPVSSPLRPALGAVALWAALASPPLRAALEGEMVRHMAVQLPLLAAVGGLLALALRSVEPRWLHAADWLGIPGIVLVQFAAAFWMLPRSLDAALGDWRMELAKFLAVPLLVGLPLASSWRRLPALGRGLVLANTVSQLGALGGLYLAAPVRLCAYYRLDQQAASGWALILVAGALGGAWFLRAFCGWPQDGRGTRAAADALRP